MRAGAFRPGLLGRDFPSDGKALAAYQAIFGVPSFRSQIFWRTLLESLDGMSFERILDVGCGGGAVAVALARLFPGSRVKGIDPDPRAVDSARSLAARAGVANVEFQLRRLEEMQPEPFDLILSLGVLEFSADPRRWLLQLTSLSEDGGTVAFTAPHRRGSAGAETMPGRFEIQQLAAWLREADCDPVTIRAIVRGPNRAVYRLSQALQAHRGWALAFHPLTLPLVRFDRFSQVGATSCSARVAFVADWCSNRRRRLSCITSQIGQRTWPPPRWVVPRRGHRRAAHTSGKFPLSVLDSARRDCRRRMPPSSAGVGRLPRRLSPRWIPHAAFPAPVSHAREPGVFRRGSPIQSANESGAWAEFHESARPPRLEPRCLFCEPRS